MDEDIGGISLAEGWSLTLSERAQVAIKSPLAHLGFAVQLKFFQNFGRFPVGVDDVADRALAYLCDQIERPVSDLVAYGWNVRLGRRHRAEVMRFLEFVPLGSAGLAELGDWLEAEICPTDADDRAAHDAIGRWCFTRRFRAPSASVTGKLLRAARRRFEDGLLAGVTAALSPASIAAMEAGLRP